MAVSYDVDPSDPKTWSNSPAPALDRVFPEELARIGGLNPHGRPCLRFVWGQERRRFFAGEERILYTDDRVDPVITHTPDTYRARNLLTGETRACSSYADLLSYDEREWERRVIRGESRAEFVGQPLWFVEQWRPAELVDTPFNWERNRYGDFEDPATGRTERRDLLGPYPSRGRYDAFFVVGEETGERVPFAGKVLKYRPVGWDVVEEVRRLFYARENTKALTAEQHLDRMVAEQTGREEKQKADLRDRIRQELWPHRHRLVEFGAMAGYARGFKDVPDFKGKLKKK